MGFQEEYREEADHRGEARGEDGAGDLAHALFDQSDKSFSFSFVLVLLHLHMADNVLHEDHLDIDHDTDGDGDARECHDVGIHSRVAHDDKGEQHAHGQDAGDDDRGPQVKDDHDHHDDGDEDLQREGRLQRADGLLDQAGAVVERDYRHLGDRTVRQRLLGQSRVHLGDLLFHVVDHLQRVRTVAGDDHPADRLHALFIESPAPRGRTQCDKRHLLDGDRHPVAYGDDRILQVGHAFNVAQPPHQVLRLVDLHRLRPDI